MVFTLLHGHWLTFIVMINRAFPFSTLLRDKIADYGEGPTQHSGTFKASSILWCPLLPSARLGCYRAEVPTEERLKGPTRAEKIPSLGRRSRHR